MNFMETVKTKIINEFLTSDDVFVPSSDQTFKILNVITPKGFERISSEAVFRSDQIANNDISLTIHLVKHELRTKFNEVLNRYRLLNDTSNRVMDINFIEDKSMEFPEVLMGYSTPNVIKINDYVIHLMVIVSDDYRSIKAVFHTLFRIELNETLEEQSERIAKIIER